MSDLSCRTYRELLGVYVVGAIEPAERGVLEAHLNQCYECREELAGLALLPALLRRVPVEEAERLAELDPHDSDPVYPSADLLNSLLRQVGARRRTRRVRSVFATAAAILIAAGGAVGASQVLTPQSPRHVQARVLDVTTASRGQLGATVRYGKTRWGTTMWVRVTGFRQWTWCKFWVVTKSGQRALAGGWTVGPGGERLWYPVSTNVPEASVTGFVITSGSKVLLRIPRA